MTATTPFSFLSFNVENDSNALRAGLRLDSEADDSHWYGQDKTQNSRQENFNFGLASLAYPSANPVTQPMQEFMLQVMDSEAFNSSAMLSNSSQESQSQDISQWSSSFSGMPFLNLQWQQQAQLGNNSPVAFTNSFINHPRQSSDTSKSEDYAHLASSSAASPPFSLKPPPPSRSSTYSLWQRRLTSKHQSLEEHHLCPSDPLLTSQSSNLYGQSNQDEKHNDSCQECNTLGSFSSLESMNPTAAALVESASSQGDESSIQHSLLFPRSSSWDSMVASSNTFDPSILQGAQWIAEHHTLNSHSSITSDFSTASSNFPITHLSPSTSNYTERDMEEEVSEEEKNQDVEDGRRYKSARSKTTAFCNPASSSVSFSCASKGVINKVATGRGGETRHLCPQAGCSKTFSTSGHARRHSRIHSSLRPFQCSSCSSTFSRRDNCVSHERSRHRSSKY